MERSSNQFCISGTDVDMDQDILRDGIQLKRSEEEMDAEFEEQNRNIEEILSRTQRSFSSRSRRCIYEGKFNCQNSPGEYIPLNFG